MTKRSVIDKAWPSSSSDSTQRFSFDKPKITNNKKEEEQSSSFVLLRLIELIQIGIQDFYSSNKRIVQNFLLLAAVIAYHIFLSKTFILLKFKKFDF